MENILVNSLYECVYRSNKSIRVFFVSASSSASAASIANTYVSSWEDSDVFYLHSITFKDKVIVIE